MRDLANHTKGAVEEIKTILDNLRERGATAAEEQSSVSEEVDRQTSFIRDLARDFMTVAKVFHKLEASQRRFTKSV